MLIFLPLVSKGPLRQGQFHLKGLRGHCFCRSPQHTTPRAPGDLRGHPAPIFTTPLCGSQGTASFPAPGPDLCLPLITVSSGIELGFQVSGFCEHGGNLPLWTPCDLQRLEGALGWLYQANEICYDRWVLLSYCFPLTHSAPAAPAFFPTP